MVTDTHNSALPHHVKQARGWLKKSNQGHRTAALSYAALEARYAIERLAVYYWVCLLNRPLTLAEAEQITTYKKLERRLYKLGGHQKQIDGTFAFMRAVLSVANISYNLPTPNLGKLSEAWQSCSEVCHVAWPLGCSAEGVAGETYTVLSNICALLDPLVEGEILGWPVIEDAGFAALRDKFVAGKATAVDVKAYADKFGLWARIHDEQDRPVRFLGEAIPPTACASDA